MLNQTDMRLDIGGDVSLSLITGLKLSAENVSLRDTSDNPLFDVERIDFALALSPLLSGKADITGITLNKPVLTLSQAAAIADDVSEAAADTANATPPAMTRDSTEAATERAAGDSIDLSALSLRHLAVREAKLISRTADGNSSTLLSGLEATVSIPDFNGPAELSGTLPYQGETLAFSGMLADVGRTINGGVSRIDLDVESDVLKAALQGELALKGDTLFLANYAANSGSVKALLTWLGVASAPIREQKLNLQGSLIVSSNEIRLPMLSLKIGEQAIESAVRVFPKNGSGNPLVRIAMESAAIDLDEILDQEALRTSGSAATSTNDAKTAPAANGNTEKPDLSALSAIDMTLDARVDHLAYQGEAVRRRF